MAVGLILLNMLYFYVPIRPIIWRLLFVILALVVTFSPNNKRTFVENSVLAFIGLNLFHYFLSFIWLVPNSTQLGNILYCLSALLLFSYLGRCGVLTERFFTICIILLSLAGIAYYYNNLALAANRLVGFDEERFTNNASVVFLFLLPSLLFIKKDAIKYVLLGIYLFFLISSVKRGNIVAAILPVIFIIYESLRNNKRLSWKTLFVFAVIIGLFYLSKEWILGNNYFLARLDDSLHGQTSNRDRIYAAAWSLWYNSDSLVNILFGYGFDGTITHIFNNYRAHNDWLEVLVNFGIIGVSLYLTIFIAFARAIKNSRIHLVKVVLLSAVSIWFLKSCYSMGFTDEYLAILAIPIGAALSGNSSIKVS